MPVRVIIVRHGERLDEADRDEWRRVRTQETLSDPPLTATGWDQASLAGGKIVAVLRQRAEASVIVYSSPTVRTLSTAAAIVRSLKGVGKEDVLRVVPAYSLNCCAAAQHHGVAKAFPKGEPSIDVTMKGVNLACWPPVGNAEEVDRRQSSGGGFVEAVKDLARCHSEGDTLVMVTHREGIWQLLRHVGGKMQSGYCNISTFNFEPQSGALTAWDTLSERSQQTSASNAHQKGQPSTPPPKNRADWSPLKPVRKTRELAIDGCDGARVEAESLQAVLERGSGMVVIHRGGSAGGQVTKLWRTPGVRGVWTEGGAIKDGDLVSLLSSPVTSEGNEGAFVLVQTPSGVEGWTKLKNVHLPSWLPH